MAVMVTLLADSTWLTKRDVRRLEAVMQSQDNGIPPLGWLDGSKVREVLRWPKGVVTGAMLISGGLRFIAPGTPYDPAGAEMGETEC